MTDSISIEVTYALPQRQDVIHLKLSSDSTVQQAIEASGLLQRHSEIDLKKNKVGVYGKLVKLDTLLHERDRVEVYRPLIADPKESRKKRAEEGKPLKQDAGEAS